MNRLKVWVFALLVAGAAALALRAHAARLRDRELAELDARLASAAAQVSASFRAMAHEAGAAAAVVARDVKLLEALEAAESGAAGPLPRKSGAAEPGPGVDAAENALRETARAALVAAEAAFGFELPTGSVVAAGNRAWLSRKGEPDPAEGEGMAALRAAIDGQTTRGHARLNGALYQVVAIPMGQGSGLSVLVPVDAAWAQAIARATAVDVTLSAPNVKPVSTAPLALAQPVAAAPAASAAPVGVGRLDRVPVVVGPVALPPLPSLFGAPPAARVRAVMLDGVEGGRVLVSLPTARALGPVIAFEWKVLFGLAGVLLAGLVTGLLVRSVEASPPLPDALLAAAERIERGDFAARAPSLAGQLGTIAAALNNAAEFAGPVAAAASATEHPLGRPLPLPATPPASEPAFPRFGGPEPTPTPGPGFVPFASAAPALEAFANPAPPAIAAPPALLQAAAQAAPAAVGDGGEDAHWRQVFQDFLRTRATCGEATEGLTYERFRLKLEGNKSALLSKYGCRSVKFQVYVKEGKAALKATPVK